MSRIIRAPRGTDLQCKGWVQEAALRMLMNNLDPDVAERPEDLVVYGGSGKAARSWEAYEGIVRSLQELESDETLLVQSGKPVGILRTHEDAPRVLIANSNLVGEWATWDHFRELEAKGLIMYGQMTAGSWIYIGTQGILQGTYETFAEAGRQHFGSDDLTGRLVVTSGLGGMGGAQPLAATMNNATFLGFDIDSHRVQRRLETRYLDDASSVDEGIDLALKYKAEGKGLSIELVANAADALERMLERGVVPDLLTDQTSIRSVERLCASGAEFKRSRCPPTVRIERTKSDPATMADHVRAMLALMRRAHTVTAAISAPLLSKVGWKMLLTFQDSSGLHPSVVL